MKRQNRLGPEILGERGPLPELANQAIARDLAADKITFVDTRPDAEVHEGTVPGALNIPAGNKAASFGAWAYDPETDGRPLVLLAPDRGAARTMRDHLVRVGIDNVAGYTPSLDGLPTEVPALIRPEELEGFDAALVLDVRNKTEHAAGHIPGSEQLSAGRVLWNLDKLPAHGPIVTYRQSGIRNSVAASTLRRAGYDVVELDGSYAAWDSQNSLESASAR